MACTEPQLTQMQNNQQNLSPVIRQILADLDNKRQPVIVFLKSSENYEYEPGMRTRCTSYDFVDEEVLRLRTNFREFADFNKQLETPIFYSTDRTPVKWSESAYYPKDFQEVLYLSGEEQDLFCLDERELLHKTLWEEFNSQTDVKVYVHWLEQKLSSVKELIK